MAMNNISKIMLAIIILTYFIGAYLYPIAPERMAIHWNAEGKADGFADKNMGLFLMPMILVFVLVLFLAIPKIDPLKKNIESFMEAYETMMLMLVIFLSYIHALSLLYNFGKTFNMTVMMLPAFASLLYVLGEMFYSAKRNWFIGIRTPWTLSNDVVWDKTHKLGAKLFKVSAAVSLVGIILQRYAIMFVIAPVLLSVLYLVLYSYLEFQKQTHI